jgi:hypothetical protein
MGDGVITWLLIGVFIAYLILGIEFYRGMLKHSQDQAFFYRLAKRNRWFTILNWPFLLIKGHRNDYDIDDHKYDWDDEE